MDTAGRQVAFKGQAYRDKVFRTGADALTGGSYLIPDDVSHVIINPAATIATFTVTLPVTPTDGQKEIISSMQIITAFTLSPSAGHTISNTITTMTAGQSFARIFHAATSQWLPRLSGEPSGETKSL